MPIAFAMAGGSWAFLAFVVLFFLAIAHGYYSRSGSAINQRPYSNGSGDAPGGRDPEHDRPRRGPARLLARHALSVTSRSARERGLAAQQ